jgi:WD40 repeat protein
MVKQAKLPTVLFAVVALGLAPLAADKKNVGVTSVSSPDGKVIVMAAGNEIRFIDVATQKLLIVIKGHQAAVTAVAFSPDGTILASGSADKTVRLRDAATGKALLVFKGHQAAIKSLAFSGDGKTLTTSGTDKTAIVWDLATGKVVRQAKGK